MHPRHGPLLPPASLALPPLVPSCPQEGQLAGRQGEEADAAPAGGGPPWGATPVGRWGWQHREPGGPPRDGALRGQGGRWDRWVWGPGDQDGPYPMSSTLTPAPVHASDLFLFLLLTLVSPPALPPAPAPDGSSGSLLCIPATPLLSGAFLLPALPPAQSYPSTAVPRTSEQKGTLVRGHLFQSADEETEARGGEAPCLRSHSELV